MNTKTDKSRKIASVLTSFCILANVPVFLFLLCGPKSGMEELAILLPWLISGAINVLLVLPAMFLALRSRQHLANSWIYFYFVVFFGFHAVYLIQVNDLDAHFHQEFNAMLKPEQAEFHKLLSELQHVPSEQKTARVVELLHNGVDVNAMFPGDSQSALQKAAYNGDPRLIRLLLEKGATMEEPSALSTTALGWAVQQNHTEAALLLLAHGAEPNGGVSGYSYLNRAVKNHNVDIVAALLKAGADPDKRILGPESPLIFAAASGDIKILQLLVDAGADLEYQLSHSTTALIMAVRNGHPECVKALLAANAKLNGTAMSGAGVLALAATGGNQEIFAIIQQAAQSIKVADNDEIPSFRNRYLDLHNALQENRLDDFNNMLRIGISPDSVFDANGSTLLQSFCMDSLGSLGRQVDKVRIVQILLDNGADSNRPTADGTTPLMSAVRTGQIELVNLLIRRGADIHAVNKRGQDALSIAMAKDRQAIVDALLSAGAQQK